MFSPLALLPRPMPWPPPRWRSPCAGADGLFHSRPGALPEQEPGEPAAVGRVPAGVGAVLRYPGHPAGQRWCSGRAALLPLQRIGSEFIPPLDEGDLMYMPTTYPGLSIGKARELPLQQTDKLIATVPEVASPYSANRPRRYRHRPGAADHDRDLHPAAPATSGAQGDHRKLKKGTGRAGAAAGLTNAWVMPIRPASTCWPPASRPRWGSRSPGRAANHPANRPALERCWSEVPGTASVYSERVAGGRYPKGGYQREQAARFGLNVADVQQVVATAIGGMNITKPSRP